VFELLFESRRVESYINQASRFQSAAHWNGNVIEDFAEEDVSGGSGGYTKVITSYMPRMGKLGIQTADEC
jgi:hypothetical protein